MNQQITMEQLLQTIGLQKVENDVLRAQVTGLIKANQELTAQVKALTPQPEKTEAERIGGAYFNPREG